jgi:glycosyltransferase involved in cell wall biosynthesis
MRIAVITTSWGPPWNEGVRNLARSLHAHLIENGDQVDVLHPEPSNSQQGSALNIRFLESVHKQGKFLIRVRHALAKNRYDAAFWFTSLSSWYGAKLRFLQTTPVPIVPFITGMRSFVRGFNRFARPAPTVTISPYLRDHFFPGSTFIPPFLPVHLKRPQGFSRVTPEDQFRLLFLGSFEAERGVECLLDAIARLDDRFCLTIAWNGGGANRARGITDRIRRLNIESRVRLIKSVNVANELQRAHLLLIPRLHKTRMAFPVRILEAAHMRLPMVVSDILGMRSIVGDAGYFAPPGDPDALANAVSSLLTSPLNYQSAVAECEEIDHRYNSSKSLQLARKVLCHAAA